VRRGADNWILYAVPEPDTGRHLHAATRVDDAATDVDDPATGSDRAATDVDDPATGSDRATASALADEPSVAPETGRAELAACGDRRQGTDDSVGVARFELAAFASRTRRATKLRYTPMR